MTREDWEVVKLGDKIHCNPQTKLNKGEEYDFLPMENIKSGCCKFPIGYAKKMNNSGGAKFQDGDTVFARITPCLQNGKICKIQGIQKGFGSTEYFVFRAIEGITDSDYVFYLMCHPYIRNLAEKSMVGASGRQRANIIVIKNLKISLPPLAEQQHIASILSAYDDLIENNTRRIALLEQMAQALYRQWFVAYKFPGHQDVEMVDSGTEFGMIPQGWEVGSIGSLYSVKSGFAFASKVFQQEGNPVIKIKNISNNSINIDDCDFVSNENGEIAYKFELKAGDVLIAMTGATIGKVGLMQDFGRKCYLNQRAGKLFPKRERLKNNAFIFFSLLSNNIYQQIVNAGMGAAQPNISGEGIEKCNLIVPDKNIIIEFQNIAGSYLRENINLQKQNQSLKEQRDFLLRKLIG